MLKRTFINTFSIIFPLFWPWMEDQNNKWWRTLFPRHQINTWVKVSFCNWLTRLHAKECPLDSRLWTYGKNMAEKSFNLKYVCLQQCRSGLNDNKGYSWENFGLLSINSWGLYRIQTHSWVQNNFFWKIGQKVYVQVSSFENMWHKQILWGSRSHNHNLCVSLLEVYIPTFRSNLNIFVKPK